ncbi:MAG: hypothetical protein ACK4UN_06020 [Limisphaerales bacterium]
MERKEPAGSSIEAAFTGSVPNAGRVIRTTEAMQDYLLGKEPYTNRELFPFPSLVLLDFDFPVMSLNLVKWFRDTGLSSMVPIIGLGQDLPQIIVQRAFDAGLNGYFEKPKDLGLLTKVICELQWVDDLQCLKFSDPGMKLLTGDIFRTQRLPQTN